MIPALIILATLVVVGSVLYLFHRRDLARGGDTCEDTDTPVTTGPVETEDGEACCGMHVTCERDSLLSAVSQDIEYFDDEELDTFIGRSPHSYDDDEIEQFRDVLLTLLPDDIAPWARSIQLRGIELPEVVRDELLMIVAEERRKKTND